MSGTNFLIALLVFICIFVIHAAAFRSSRSRISSHVTKFRQNRFVSSTLVAGQSLSPKIFGPQTTNVRPSSTLFAGTTESNLDGMMNEKNDQEFDAAEFEKALKDMGVTIGPTFGGGGKKNKVGSELDNEMLDKLRDEQNARNQEEIFRKYPFDNFELPVLPDCNNYYSGKFGDYFWHQNADQVFVFIPLSDDAKKSDISIKFTAKSVDIKIKGVDGITLQCNERIIPDGSFWLLENDKATGKRYLQLDLEKRLRMINWKNLFGEASPDASLYDEATKRNEMLEKLFAANKGMAKFTGATPDSIDDMRSDEELMRSIVSKINPSAEVVDTGGLEDEEVYDLIDRDDPMIESIDIGSKTVINPHMPLDSIDAEIVGDN